MRIAPNELKITCRLTLLEPMSHHDAGLSGDSNVNLYRRQLVQLPRSAVLTLPPAVETERVVNELARAFPVPADCAELFSDEPFERFIAIAFAKVFIATYGRSDEGTWGEGLFEGTRAYTRLADRLSQVAARTADVKSFWSALVKAMRVGIPVTHRDALFKLLALPSAFHHEFLYQAAQHGAMIVEMARYWNDTEKLQQPAYAKAASKPQADTANVTLALMGRVATALNQGAADTIAVAVPHHSGNDIRHAIRENASDFLLARLGCDESTDTLPNAVKALLFNGGNIAKGKSAGHKAYALSQEIRARYPQLGLLGGSTASFLLGDSHLKSVSAFWHGREFNPALETLFGVTAEASIVDALDTWTLHRHVTRHDGSPMPFSFEVVQAGTRLYVHFGLSPYITELESGALWHAIETWRAIDSTLGGQAARGFGRVKIDVLEAPAMMKPAARAYTDYLAANADVLKTGLMDGTLGTDTEVC